MSDLERADEIMAAVIEARGDAQIQRVREAIAQTLADERAEALRRVRALVDACWSEADLEQLHPALRGSSYRVRFLRAIGSTQ